MMTESLTENRPMRRLVVGISGASGAIYGIRLLQMLRALSVETHAIISASAEITIAQETDWKLADVRKLADHCHDARDMAAPVSSGSFPASAMIVAPCSVKTLAEIATGNTQGLIARAADVMLKERRPLILMLRETPLHAIHLRNALTLAEMGAVIAPPVPAFYARPNAIPDMVDHTLGRILDLLGLDSRTVKRWGIDQGKRVRKQPKA